MTTHTTDPATAPIAEPARTRSKILSFDDILRAKPHVYRTVPAPELGGDLRVRGFTAAERDVWESSRMREKPAQKNGNGDEPTGSGYTQDFSSYRVMAVALATVQEDGTPMFSAVDADGVLGVSETNLALVGGWPAAVVGRAFGVIIDLSKLTETSQKALEGN